MVIDVQHHYVPPAMREAAPRRSEDYLRQFYEVNEHPVYELETRLEAMNAAGIDRAVLSLSRSDPEVTADPAAAAELYGRCNAEMIDAADLHPERFSVLIALPFPHADLCVQELDRVGRHPAVDGVIFHCEVSKWTPDQPELEPVFAEIASLGMPVMIHPQGHQLGPADVLDDWKLWSSIAPMVETSVVAARMMLSGLLDRVPDLTLIHPHLAGILPFILQRLTNQSGSGSAEHDVRWYLENRILTDAANLTPSSLEAAATVFPVERILLASDYPAAVSRNLDDLTKVLARAVEYVRSSRLSPAEQLSIIEENATRLGFGRGRIARSQSGPGNS